MWNNEKEREVERERGLRGSSHPVPRAAWCLFFVCVGFSERPGLPGCPEQTNEHGSWLGGTYTVVKEAARRGQDGARESKIQDWGCMAGGSLIANLAMDWPMQAHAGALHAAGLL